MRGQEIHKVFQLQNRKKRDDLEHTDSDETILLKRKV